MTASPVIQLQSVTLRRSGQTILDRITWSVQPGTVAALIGPNGSGKSSLVSVIAGCTWPTSGTVRVLDQTFGCTDLHQLRRRIGLIETSRAPQFVPNLSVREVVATGLVSAYMLLQPQAITPDQWRQIDHELQTFHLAELAPTPFRRLSTGEQARTLIARAMVGRPELLILDEPAAGLDIAGRFQLVRTLETLHRRPNAPTILLVTHHLDELPATTSNVALMQGGAIVCHGPAASTLTDANLTGVFNCPIQVIARNGRYTAALAP